MPFRSGNVRNTRHFSPFPANFCLNRNRMCSSEEAGNKPPKSCEPAKTQRPNVKSHYGEMALKICRSRQMNYAFRRVQDPGLSCHIMRWKMLNGFKITMLLQQEGGIVWHWAGKVWHCIRKFLLVMLPLNEEKFNQNTFWFQFQSSINISFYFTEHFCLSIKPHLG